MSEAERKSAEYVAQHVVANILDAVQDKETASRIMDVWGGEIDRTIGRGMRRAMWYLFIALVGIAAMKFGLLEKVLAGMLGK